MTIELHHLMDSGASQAVINERIAALIERGDSAYRDHELRIRRLEHRTSWGMGAMAAISAAVSTFIALWGKK